MCVGVWVSVLYRLSHCVGPTVVKFGIEDHIYPAEVVEYILFWYPYPQGWGP